MQLYSLFPVIGTHHLHCHLKEFASIWSHNCRLTQEEEFQTQTIRNDQFISMIVAQTSPTWTYSPLSHFKEVFLSRMDPSLHSSRQMADSVYDIAWVSRFLTNVKVPHGGRDVMVWGRHEQQTPTAGAFYRWQFAMLWRDCVAHYNAIHPLPSPHVAAW